jgi:Protein of unknown function (DUF1236)
MKRFIGTAIVAALAALIPYGALAQSGKTPNPPNHAVQAEVKKALEAEGFTDVKVDPQTFAVQAKDPSGSPVMMLINPDLFSSATEHDEQEPTQSTSLKTDTAQNSGPIQRNIDDELVTGSLGESSKGQTPTLTPGQKQAVWDSLSSEKTMRANRPNDYIPRVGATLPNGVSVQPLPDDVIDNFPALTGYRFAVARNTIVIVSPTSKRVIDVFGEQ